MKQTQTPREVTVNKEQGLYVIPCGDGYSCLGFEVAQRQATAVLKWLDQRRNTFLGNRDDMRVFPELFEKPGTIEHYRQYQKIMEAGRSFNARCGQRCDADLIPALIGLEGQRVEVITPAGDKSRFYVGKSTGWMPCHLAISRINATGGIPAYVPEGSTVRVVGGKHR